MSPRLSMADSRVIQKAKIPTYTNTIATYNTIIVGLPSQVAYDRGLKNARLFTTSNESK